MGDLSVARWRAWYVDGSTVDGASFSEWEEMPDDGLLSVLLWFESGTSRIMQGDDLYFATPEGIYAHDSRYSLDEIETRYPGASVKRGQWTTDEHMRAVHDEVTRTATEE